MYFDYFTAAALVDELNAALAGGRVQDVLQIDDLALGLEVYAQQQRHYLYLSADPEQPRVHLASGKLRRGSPNPSPLALLLTRYVEGGKLLAVRQPPWERILIFDLLHGEGEFSLIVEPIERRANILLVEGGTIRECIRRVKADENRVRLLLPGQPYHPPPPQEKLPPAAVSPRDIETLLYAEGKAAAALTRGVQGISPLLAREIVFQAFGKTDTPAQDADPTALYAAFRLVMLPLIDHQWQPGYTNETDEDGETFANAFAVFPLMHLPDWTPAESVSAALEAYYGELAGEKAYESAKRPIRRQLKNAKKKAGSKLYSLRQQERDDREMERLRQSGELLLTYQFQIKKGQTEFTAVYDLEGEPLKVKLDPLLTAVENAQHYFEKYEKGKRSRHALPELVEAAANEVAYLEQLEVDLSIAANWQEIGEVQEALIAAGYWQGAKRRQTTGKSSPLKLTWQDGTVLWVGRNSAQNEEVTFKKGAPDDIWVHAREVPGAHVIIKSGGNPPSPALLEYAGGVALYFSALRNAPSGELYVTERKHLRKIKGGKPGMVLVTKETYPSLRATPRPPA